MSAESAPCSSPVVLRLVLRALGYEGSLMDEEEEEEVALAKLVSSGASCQELTALCCWLVTELRQLCSLEEDVSPTSGPEDADTFQLEMSGVLSELNCPYTSLTSGDVTSRLTNAKNCLLLLEFLSSELQAARLLSRRLIPVPEQSEAAEELRQISQALNMPEPTLSSPVSQLLEEMRTKVSDLLSTLPESEAVTSPLLRIPLDPHQWDQLQQIQQALCVEYECRMRMLVTRFHVTLQSFHWSERSKDREKEMFQVYTPLRSALTAQSRVTLAHILAMREDTSRIVKTSSGASREKTSCSVNKVLMGSVPDRGGRPNEIEPPMPMWEKRRERGGDSGRKHWKKHGRKKNR
ncbi:protein FAM98C isoform X1 [Microcaecilia unicolor]|uniref:Protein FAM98C isoform X1 n=2 Tax=Microcaecilia unicolor TaxID=1415580 RepID=A0A6P7ZK27_9AMPH|nr:protein FAM98C isoform X1 [Microcaecilia unicolor]